MRVLGRHKIYKNAIVDNDKKQKFKFEFWSQHPAAHGVLRPILELDGEVVEKADPI